MPKSFLLRRSVDEGKYKEDLSDDDDDDDFHSPEKQGRCLWIFTDLF